MVQICTEKRKLWMFGKRDVPLGGTGESVRDQSNTSCGKQEGDWSSLRMRLHADAQPQMA